MTGQPTSTAAHGATRGRTPQAPTRPTDAARTAWWWRRTLLAFGPLVLFAVAAIVVGLTAPAGTVDLRFPPATLVMVVGILTSGVLAVVLLWVPAARAASKQRAEAARTEAAEAERAAHRRFLARLDHELKNPVTAIRSALAVDGDAPEQNVRIAAAQASRLATLVGQLRGLASLESRPIESAPVDITALTLEEVAAVQDETAARGSRRAISTAFPAAPWPLPPVSGDADLLAVAVRNVLLNAVKYSGEGAQIEVRGSDEGGTVMIEIADTGAGIRAEDLPFVWDELWRASEARGVEGSGLGLSLVRVVVERHGGDVAVRSQLGRGTSVRLRLPAARAERAAHVSLPS